MSNRTDNVSSDPEKQLSRPFSELTKAEKTAYYLELESYLRNAIGILRTQVGDEDLRSANQYLEHREYGLAFSTLLFLISETDTEIEPKVIIPLRRLKNRMGFESSSDEALFANIEQALSHK